MLELQRGDRVRLVHTSDPHTRLQPGDEGTVGRVTEDTVGVSWDSGSSLSMLINEGDDIELVS